MPDLVDRDVDRCASPRRASAVRRSLVEARLPRAHLHEARFDL